MLLFSLFVAFFPCTSGKKLFAKLLMAIMVTSLTCTQAKVTAIPRFKIGSPMAAIWEFSTSSEGSYHLLNDSPTCIVYFWHSACRGTLADIALHNTRSGICRKIWYLHHLGRHPSSTRHMWSCNITRPPSGWGWLQKATRWLQRMLSFYYCKSTPRVST